MKYVLLIYDEERTWGKLSPADQQAMMAEYRKFTEELKASSTSAAHSCTRCRQRRASACARASGS